MRKILFYDDINLINTDVSKFSDYTEKVVLDPFIDEVPEGFILASREIRDNLDVHFRPMQWVSENAKDDSYDYRVLTKDPEIYEKYSIKHNVIDLS
jgi:hypothetical protein